MKTDNLDMLMDSDDEIFDRVWDRVAAETKGEEEVTDFLDSEIEDDQPVSEGITEGGPGSGIKGHTTPEEEKAAQAAAVEKTYDSKGWDGGFNGVGGRDEFVRLGVVPDSGRSRNSIDDTEEEGVSGFRLQEDGEGLYFSTGESGDDWFIGRPVFLIKGNEVGTGSDGEPLFDADTAKTTRRLVIKKGKGRKWRIIEMAEDDQPVSEGITEGGPGRLPWPFRMDGRTGVA